MPGPSAEPLPPELSLTGFRIGEGLGAGLSHKRLRAADLDRTYWGLRSANAVTTIEERCDLIRHRMSAQAFFSHTTAARLLGIPIPWRFETSDDLHISIPRPARAPHATGIRGHRSSATDEEIMTLRSLRVTTPARTWSDLADLITTFDLVAAGDAIIHHRAPMASRDQLAEAIRVRTNPRNIRRLHNAFPLLDDRSESPPESILRAIMISAGFEEPVVNHDVTDRFGEFVARTDLRFVKAKLVLEYQGDYHRTTNGQWRADMTRRAKLEALGWVVIELNADDLRDPTELVTRIRTRLRNRR